MENLEILRRSTYCGHVDETLCGNKVTIMGWVNRVRKLGQLIFITLRDHTGLVQISLNESSTDAILFQKALSLKSEYVVAVVGDVALRSEKDINHELKTGKIEVIAQSISLLSSSEVPPFQIGDETVSEALRLKHRYLDLRSITMQHNLRTRSRASLILRNFLHNLGFTEIETPILTNSSPEGARDYLVPSRVQPGLFYALPQSPQILKQILMIGSFDKYFQIAKCLRDEDLRSDRQPEFTQIDIEMSFIDMQDIIKLSEELLADIFKQILDIDIPLPVPQMSYSEAMRRFGSDKPDLRFSMELTDISLLVANSGFGVFDSAISEGGSVRGILACGLAKYSRKQVDALIEYVKTYKAKGLAYIQIMENNEVKSSLSKFFTKESLQNIIESFNAKRGDLILICADKDEIVFDALGNLRNYIAKKENLVDNNQFKPIWITDFPLFEFDDEDNRFYARHHPFTAPLDCDIHFLETKPSEVRAKAYDLVLNGYELAGGSIRIHRRDIQEQMFKTLGYSLEEANKNFSHLMEALRYGCPPHGGIAWGLDRLSMLLCNTTNIRDVIAFPKQQDGSCPLTSAPNTVFKSQLDELKISVSG